MSGMFKISEHFKTTRFMRFFSVPFLTKQINNKKVNK